jgi:hypothetical protein
LFLYNSHFWKKAFLSFLSAYSPVLIFLVSLRIRLSGGSLSSLQLHVLSSVCFLSLLSSAAIATACLLQLSLLSGAAIAGFCCCCRYCLLQLSLVSAAAVATVCCSYCYSSAAAIATRLLQLSLLQPVTMLCNCFCRYCLLQLMQLMHLSVAASAAPMD